MLLAALACGRRVLSRPQCDAPAAPGPRAASGLPSGRHLDRAPCVGRVAVGVFAPESMPDASVSISALDNDAAYSAYRQAIRAEFGADLAEMNYLGVGLPGWQNRCRAFADWLARASRYGDPTIALEPNGKSRYGAFRDSDEMRDLRSVFAAAGRAGIVVWVRFASESNLRYSDYTVYNNPAAIASYRRAVRWFRAYMPGNVRLVFSPLINTAYLKNPAQLRTLEEMYQPGAYDRIGGTLYATSWLRPRPAFDWYYRFMRRMDPSTPFEICELGGTYPRSTEVKAFLVRAARGDWPGVQRVNLFAGDLNPLATAQHGHFGFLLPGATSSYLADLFDPSTAARAFSQSATDQELARMEEIGAGWSSGDMTLDGTIARIERGRARFQIRAEFVTDELGARTALDPPRSKTVLITPDCAGAERLARSRPGDSIEAVGWDSGDGTPLRARQISAGDETSPPTIAQ